MMASQQNEEVSQTEGLLVLEYEHAIMKAKRRSQSGSKRQAITLAVCGQWICHSSGSWDICVGRQASAHQGNSKLVTRFEV